MKIDCDWYSIFVRLTERFLSNSTSVFFIFEILLQKVSVMFVIFPEKYFWQVIG